MARNDISEPEGKVCVAQIGAAHGIAGALRVKLFSDDAKALTRYGPLESADGSRQFVIEAARPSKSVFVCRIRGVKDRNEAESLNGVKLYVARDKLPEPGEEEFYYSDLIGLDALLESGDVLGRIVAVHDFGAGDLLDIAPDKGKSVLIPFTREAVPEIDLSAGRVVVSPPPGLLDAHDADEKALEGEAVDFTERPDLLDGLKEE